RRRQPRAVRRDRCRGRPGQHPPRGAGGRCRAPWRRGVAMRADPPDAAIAPAPRTNPELLGHEGAESALRRLFEAGRLPHALLLSGPRGIGKVTLAFRLARFVLANGEGEGLPGGFFGEPGASGLAIAPDSGTFR